MRTASYAFEGIKLFDDAMDAVPIDKTFLVEDFEADQSA